MKLIEYYNRYFENAKSFCSEIENLEIKKGDLIEVKTTDIMPNPRHGKKSDPENNEWDSVDNNYVVSKEPILVSFFQKDYMVITDGHHRHKKAFSSGDETILVRIESVDRPLYGKNVEDYLRLFK